MVIEKLVIKNFAAFKNAANCTQLTLNLNECKNKICLIIGPNGSGKTSLLSLLSPFADLGNLDVRNNQPLILKDKEGYKEIHIRKNDDLYVIKHIYTPHKDKSHSVKSYIELNGAELNQNGNVTSFKEIVKNELSIEPEYLKLIRLGNNVTSLISLSETERKNFMSKILDDIGVYLDYYKNVNTKLRTIKETTNHTINKIEKLGIFDKKIIESEINNLKTDLDELHNKVNSLSQDLAVNDYELTNIKNNVCIDDLGELKTLLANEHKRYEKMSRIIENKDSLKNTDTEFYEKEIDRLNKQNIADKNTIEGYKLVIQNNLTSIDNLTNQLHNLNIQKRKDEEIDKELERYEGQLTEIRLELRRHESILKDFNPNFTKQDLESFLVFLKNTQLVLNKTYEFGKKPIKKVIKLMESNQNVNQYITSHIVKLNKESHDDIMLLARLYRQFIFNHSEEVIVCQNECQAKALFNSIKTMVETAENDKDKNDLSFYQDMDLVYTNLKNVLPQFSNYSGIIESLPDDYKNSLSLTCIYERICNLDKIYDEEKFNELLTKITAYESYQDLLKEYDKIDSTRRTISSISKNDYLDEQLKLLQKDYDEKIETNSDYSEKTHDLNERIDESNFTLNSYKDILEALKDFEGVKESLEFYESNYKLALGYIEKITEINSKLNDIDFIIESKNKELNEKTTRLHDYEVLTKDLKKFNKIYDEMTLVKNSLSAKEGIPLKKIFRYLGDTEEITNELLSLVYGDSMYIDKFEISPTTFSIPIYNRGFRIPDVKYLSQGELSFVSIALSFALSSKTLRKYNIMLLDEVDGPLDTENRSKFIDIIENQIDRIDSEQNFLITHNSMFSSYPVDIIDLSFKEPNNDYTLANYISIDRK